MAAISNLKLPNCDLKCCFSHMYVIFRVIENVPIFIDMVRELIVGLQSKQSEICPISAKSTII